MFKLIRLYSEDNRFREINFTDGINLICGEKAILDDGTVISNKQNGVGKSLAIELINFCLLKGSSESRVRDIKDEFLPRESYVYLHFQMAGINYIFARNKKGLIRIKESDRNFQDHAFEDAKNLLNNILGLSDKLISARDYLNFTIKEEDYTYKEFAELYKSNYADLLKVHFYFFNLPVESLTNIKKALEDYRAAQGEIGKIEADLKSKNLDIKQLRAKQNEFQAKAEEIEDSLDYPNIMKDIEEKNLDINAEEKKLNEYIFEKKELDLQLLEINDFTSVISDDFYIDDKDLQIVFNKFKNGLGDLITKDINNLKDFKNQVLRFKSELLSGKKKVLEENIKKLQSQIQEKQDHISTYYNDVIESKSSNFVKGFKILRRQLDESENYSAYIKTYARQEEIKKTTKSRFNAYFELISQELKSSHEAVESFKKTFTQIHQSIMRSSECDFSLITANVFKAKSYFQFNIYIQGQGSKGINQMQAVIYDLALLENSHTKERHLRTIIHDNLIFGSVDKDSSINTLNYLSSIDPKSFQYIATVNKDDFDYKELEEKFSFNKDTAVVIELTKDNPLFPDWKT